MKKRTRSYPHVRVESTGRGVVSRADSVLLVETARKTGLDTVISAALAPWCKPRAVHDPGTILPDVALAVAAGGDRLADVSMLRAEPAMFGLPVASPAGLPADRHARSGRATPPGRNPQRSVPCAPARMGVGRTHGAGCDRLCDCGPGRRPGERAYRQGRHGRDPEEEDLQPPPADGLRRPWEGVSGEPAAAPLRPGNAAATPPPITSPPPNWHWPSCPSPIGAGAGHCTHEFVAWLVKRGRWLSYSVGKTITDTIHQAVLTVPLAAWTPAAEPNREVRDGAWVAELTGGVLDRCPKGMRLNTRKERPNPGPS